MKNKNIILKMCINAMCLALLIIFSQISINVGLVKFTLQLIMVFLIGLLLDLKNGLFVIFTYLFLGLLGLPFFASGGAGIGYIYNPTFGFVYSFVIVILWLNMCKKIPLKNNHKNIVLLVYFISCMISLLFVYGIGFLHGYWILNIRNGANYKLGNLLKLFILPYIPFDLLKIILVILVIFPVKKQYKKMLLS